MPLASGDLNSSIDDRVGQCLIKVSQFPEVFFLYIYNSDMLIYFLDHEMKSLLNITMLSMLLSPILNVI